MSRYRSNSTRLASRQIAHTPRSWQPDSIQPGTWVQLSELPSPFSFDQALLLCQEADDRWLAWIPDFGEIGLHPSQFQV